MPESADWGELIPRPRNEPHYDEDDSCNCTDHRLMRGEGPWARRLRSSTHVAPDPDTPFRTLPGETGLDARVFGDPVNIEQDQTPAFMGWGEDGYDWYILAIRRGKANAHEFLIKALREGGWRQSEVNRNIWSKG